ncbi:hypothetical protein GY45DRAFT_418655 [Cubamyces sp. BRFM 1775]|nr:hypothetical protein GY45DRAFT_418655 [Cubamyces sp. BRFM 1775]
MHVPRPPCTAPLASGSVRFPPRQVDRHAQAHRYPDGRRPCQASRKRVGCRNTCGAFLAAELSSGHVPGLHVLPASARDEPDGGRGSSEKVTQARPRAWGARTLRGCAGGSVCEDAALFGQGPRLTLCLRAPVRVRNAKRAPCAPLSGIPSRPVPPSLRLVRAAHGPLNAACFLRY